MPYGIDGAESWPDAIQTVTGITPGIKWPNDIVMDGQEGLWYLTEMSTEMTWDPLCGDWCRY